MTGDFRFGDGFAIYTGPVEQGRPHRHAAYQIAVARDAPIRLTVDGACHETARGWLIPPLTPHAIACAAPAVVVFLDIHAALTRHFPRPAPGTPPRVLDGQTLPFAPTGTADDIARTLSALAKPAGLDMDRRLAAVLERIGREPGAARIAEAAQAAGISVSRLRALARRDLGVPLSTWLIWRKLDLAFRAVAAGAGLGEAAAAGGFADQSHLSRAMRRMVGMSPATAAQILRARWVSLPAGGTL